MGLDIFLVTKSADGQVEALDRLANEEWVSLSRSLCHAYCDYGGIGKESILYRSIKAMGLSPDILFRMDYFGYAESDYVEHLFSEAESEAERQEIQQDYTTRKAASWQPVGEVAELLQQVDDYLAQHDITAAMYISRDYRPYFAQDARGNPSEFETDMRNMARLARLAQQKRLPWISFHMG